MVYSGDLKSPVARHTGSSPVSRTTHNGLLVKWDNSAMAWQHREFDSPTVHQSWVTLEIRGVSKAPDGRFDSCTGPPVLQTKTRAGVIPQLALGLIIRLI